MRGSRAWCAGRVPPPLLPEPVRRLAAWCVVVLLVAGAAAVVVVALTAGPSVAGVLGMLLAVPLTAAAFGVLGEVRRHDGHPAAGVPPS